MVSYNGQFTTSHAGGDIESSAVDFGADVSQTPVFLSVDVIPSYSFARLMLALGRVVRMQDTGAVKDHSAYQEWVHGEYLKELPDQMASGLIQVPQLKAQHRQVSEQIGALRQVVSTYQRHDPFWDQRLAFWSWLKNHNRDAWWVLDPIVSVQPDATFFEAFSLDESIYARVTLPHEATVADQEPVLGTTNIDFGVGLERELARTRSYRPLHLSVGADAVSLQTGVSSTVERKIDLPETWVRGLVEVQAALALSPITVTIKASALADILAVLEAEREKHGPRALVFLLTPGEPVTVLIQPWGQRIVASDTPYSGPAAQEIKVWGRRRLRVLKDLLPLTDEVTVRLVDSGMPSFWSIGMDGIDLTIGLSGWTSQDWAGRARFSAILPASAAQGPVDAAATELRSRSSMTVDDLVSALNVSPGEARILLQRLCVAGTAMYDATTNRYRWRALFPTVDLSADTGAGLEERRGVELYTDGVVALVSDEIEEKERTIRTTVSSNDRMNSVTIRRDEDSRVLYAQCDCSHFRHHKLRQGPCRHIVATSLAGG